jgi:hypothetical protein
MKIRSKALYQYLLDAGVLNSTPEEIAAAKRAYRKAYRDAWKKRKAPLSKELRITYTLREYRDMQIHARILGISPTALCKRLTQAAVGHTGIIPHQEELQELLQCISMTLNTVVAVHAHPELIRELHQAEAKLLTYLKAHSL